tara:strand:- start:148 stop:1095 length:948 start_codon:yes stop_codon:yes gene_type:complete
MAINVNTVYQTVLLILNKEQRGYMTPVEFNKTGAQAQLEIFETYFDSLNQQIRVPQTSADYSNRVVSLEEKLSIFKEFGDAASVSASSVFNLPQQFSGSGAIATTTLPAATAAATTQYVIQTATANQIANGVVEVFLGDVLISETEYSIAGLTISFNSTPVTGQGITVNIYPKQFYKLGQVLHDAGGTTIPQELQEVGRDELYHLLSSDLTAPSANNIIYLYEKNQLTVYPTTIVSGVQVAYLRKPLPPIWNFTPGSNNSYLYKPSTSFNFELNPVEQTELILKILLYAGVVVKSPEIVQVAAQQVAQENVNQKS